MEPNWAKVFFDGGGRNPGPCAGGAVIYLPDGKNISVSKFLGDGTNNVAEYGGIILGLTTALELGIKRVQIFGDSQLVVRQLLGEYKCKVVHLKPLYAEAMALLRKFDAYEISWVPREQNKLADAAVSKALQDI